MNIHDIQCRTVTTGFELQAQISEGSKVHPVWFRWPGPPCPTPGDVFLLLGLLPAMTIGGQLRIEETVSERLFQALASIQKFFLKLDPALHAVEVVLRGSVPGRRHLPAYRRAKPAHSPGGSIRFILRSFICRNFST